MLWATFLIFGPPFGVNFGCGGSMLPVHFVPNSIVWFQSALLLHILHYYYASMQMVSYDCKVHHLLSSKMSHKVHILGLLNAHIKHAFQPHISTTNIKMQTSTKCCFKECFQKMHASWNHQITQMVKRIVSNYRLANCNYKSIWRKQLIQLIQALNEDDPSAKYKNCTSKILITILCKWHIWNKTNQEKYLLLRRYFQLCKISLTHCRNSAASC